MEIKVAIRVKVLVSPLPPQVYCSLENLLFLFLVLPAAPFLFSTPILPLLLPRFGLHFDSVGTDTAAGGHLDNLLLFLIFFRPDCYSGLFSRSGNNLRPGYPSSGHYVCNILTDNHFSFYSIDYRELAVIDRRKIAIYTVLFSLSSLPSLCLAVWLRRFQKHRWWSNTRRITAIIRRERTCACKFLVIPFRLHVITLPGRASPGMKFNP